MTESTLEQIQADTKDAMKAGDKTRVGALRLIADALQKDLKSGGEDEVAVLRRTNPKPRLDWADRGPCSPRSSSGCPERCVAIAW